jgi:hypothetical protein
LLIQGIAQIHDLNLAAGNLGQGWRGLWPSAGGEKTERQKKSSPDYA